MLRFYCWRYFGLLYLWRSCPSNQAGASALERRPQHRAHLKQAAPTDSRAAHTAAAPSAHVSSPSAGAALARHGNGSGSAANAGDALPSPPAAISLYQSFLILAAETTMCTRLEGRRFGRGGPFRIRALTYVIDISVAAPCRLSIVDASKHKSGGRRRNAS